MSLMDQFDAHEGGEATTERYTFTHQIGDAMVDFDFDFTGDQTSTNDKLFAAVVAWNNAHPDEEPTTIDQVLTGRWLISKQTYSSMSSSSDGNSEITMPRLTFMHEVDGKMEQIEFDYPGDMANSAEKFSAAIKAWNDTYPNSPTTESEVRAGRWRIFLPMNRIPGTPTIF